MSEIPIINLGYATIDVRGLLSRQLISIQNELKFGSYKIKLLLTLKDFYSFINHPSVKGDIYNIDIVKSSGVFVKEINGEYFGITIKGRDFTGPSSIVCEYSAYTDQGLSLIQKRFPINFGGK